VAEFASPDTARGGRPNRQRRGKFSICADGRVLPKCVTLNQRGSQCDQLDDHSLVPLAVGRLGRCHRRLVDGGHSHAGANMARTFLPQRHGVDVGRDDYIIAARPGFAGAGRRRHDRSAAHRDHPTDYPLAACNSAHARFGRDEACWPPLAILATVSTEWVIACQVMSGITRGRCREVDLISHAQQSRRRGSQARNTNTRSSSVSFAAARQCGSTADVAGLNCQWPSADHPAPLSDEAGPLAF